MTNARVRAVLDPRTAPLVSRRRVLGVGLGLAAATAIRSLLGADAALAQSILARPDQLEGSLIMQTGSDVQAVSPALDRYQQDTLFGELWTRPDLSARDRSIVTVSALIARNQTIELPTYVALALDNGVTPRELSEIITHLAFYAGWANATAAIAVVKGVFAQRGIGVDQLPVAAPRLLPLDQAAEDQRAASVEQSTGPVSPGLVHFTGAALFRDLWLRPDLAPRDRSLVTVSALVTAGQVGQITVHLGRAMDNGLTKTEASEVLAHLAFYAGWPNAFSSVPVFKGVFDSRPNA